MNKPASVIWLFRLICCKWSRQCKDYFNIYTS